MPLVGMTAEALDSLFYKTSARPLEVDRVSREMPAARSAENRAHQLWQTLPSHSRCKLVFRQSLSEEEGEGYWEFQRLSNDVVISWTKAVYKRDTWINIPGPSAAFKIRLVLSGELSHPDSKLHMRGPTSMLSVYPAHTNNGYILRGGIDTEFIVLHCRPLLLTKYLDVLTEDLPAPFEGLTRSNGRPVTQFMSPLPNLQYMIRDLFKSRFRYSPPIQPFYLEARIQEILCNVMQDLVNRHGGHQTKTGLQAPDVRRVREAQRILLQELVSPPQIGALARRVGVSQTKLKANFKALAGETIYSFVKRSRMERAAQLLLEGAATVSEVAYAVGYEYAANFTPVFKQHFGMSPRQWLLLQKCRF
jgi:AraC-like DNA-binding protein